MPLIIRFNAESCLGGRDRVIDPFICLYHTLIHKVTLVDNFKSYLIIANSERSLRFPNIYSIWFLFSKLLKGFLSLFLEKVCILI